MDIVIAGSGTIGRHIADLLTKEQHNVAMIDLNPDSLMMVEDSLDIQTLRGSANNPDILRQAGVEKAQLFLGMTNQDETNLISCMTARQLGARKTVARVRQPFYQTDDLIPYHTIMGIDMIISPEWHTALEFVRHIDHPDAIAIESFADGRLHMRQMQMVEDHPLEGRRLADLQLPEDLLIVMIGRGDELIIPHGDNKLLAGDRLTVLGLPASVNRFAETFETTESDQPIKNIFLAGGGIKGRFLAQMLERKNYNVTLLEYNRSYCEHLSTLLKKTKVVWGDATRLPVLKEERVNKADLFVAATGDDEHNLMSCLQAKSLGVERVFTVMNRPDYAKTVEEFGIDLAISPRYIAGARVLALLKRGRIRSLSIIEEGRAEVVEFRALPDSPAIKEPLKKLARHIPEGALIASIIKDGELIIPRGDTVINPGDIVITISLSQHFAAVEQLFGSRLNG